MAGISFLDLPGEVRNKIYHEHFEAHRGRVYVKARPVDLARRRLHSSIKSPSPSEAIKFLWESAWQYISGSNVDCGSCQIERDDDGNMDNLMSPLNLLLTSKTVLNEAFAMFTHSTTWHFRRALDMEYFLNKQTASFTNVRSIIIDQSVCRSKAELEQMLCYATTFPALMDLHLYLDNESYMGTDEWCDIVRNIFCKQGPWDHLDLEGLFILDPYYEAEFVARLHDYATTSLGQFWHIQAFNFLSRPGGGPFDRLTDEVRSILSSRRGDSTAFARMGLWRHAATVQYVMIEEIEGRDRADLRALLFCRNHGIMDCPSRSHERSDNADGSSMRG